MKNPWPAVLVLTTTLGCTGAVGFDGQGGAGGGIDLVVPPAGDGSTAIPSSGLPCDVEALLRSRCQGCHSSPPTAGAPFALVSYDDARAHAPQSVIDMMNGAMPPGGPRASTADIQILKDWIGAGFPMGPAICASGDGTPDAGSGSPGTDGSVITGVGGDSTGGGGGSGSGGSGGSGGAGPATGTGGAGAGTPNGLPCDVASLLQGSCQSCHSSPPRNGAPFALVTYADAKAHAAAATSAMSSGAMPPGGPMSTSAQIQILQSWIDASFPNGTCGSTTGVGGAVGTGTGGGSGTGGLSGTGGAIVAGTGGITGTGGFRGTGGAIVAGTGGITGTGGFRGTGGAIIAGTGGFRGTGGAIIAGTGGFRGTGGAVIIGTGGEGGGDN
jgi:mono/diheme cytochrome c family protein